MSTEDQIVVVKVDSPDKIVIENNANVVSEASFIDTATVTSTGNVVVQVDSVQTITIGIGATGAQGPQGLSGGEEEMPYAKQVDFVGEDVIYRGEAAVGSPLSDPVWRIRKIEFVGVDDDVSEKWASGNANFDKIWNNRAGLSYV